MTALQQSPQFARALSAFGADLRSTVPVVMQRRIGPVGRIDFASRIRPEALTYRPRLINAEVNDPKALRALGYRQILTPAHVAEWDLTRGDLRAGLSGKWRNRLVKAEFNRLRVRETCWNGTPHPMFPAAEALARKRRYRSYPTDLLAQFALLNPNEALLFEAYDRGILCAACLVLRHGRTATYQTAWSTERGHALQAPRALLWAAAKRLANLGHKTFDLGTVETDHAPGLARFKLGTGADLRPLGGTWVRLRPPRHRASPHQGV